jgi:hypothetical protein
MRLSLTLALIAFSAACARLPDGGAPPAAERSPPSAAETENPVVDAGRRIVELQRTTPAYAGGALSRGRSC